MKCGLYLSTSDMACELDVHPSTVTQWRRRHPPESAHPFPEPDIYARPSNRSPLWRVERLDEIWEWWRSRPTPVRTGRPPGSRLGGNTLIPAKKN